MPSSPLANAFAAPAQPPSIDSELTRIRAMVDRAQFLEALSELAQLVEKPLKTLESRTGSWRWRDWQVIPAAEGRWRLAREASGSGEAERNRDG